MKSGMGKKKSNQKMTRKEFLGNCLRCSLSLSLGPAVALTSSQAEGQGPKRGFVRPRAAAHYRSLDDKMVLCELCPQLCVVTSGQRGGCGVREHRDGQLITLVYGNPCAVHVDPIEKKPLMHFLPGSRSYSIATAGCNLHCKNCQNWEISQRRPEETYNYDLPPEALVAEAVETGCSSISYTYSEPNIFFEYVMDAAALAQEGGLRNVLVTAGYINPDPQRELCRLVDAANVDLKGFTETFYQDICSCRLQPVLDALVLYREEGVWVEVTNLVLPTLNDDEVQIRKMCQWLLENLGDDVPLHFSRFHPMYRLKNLPPTPVETLDRARNTALDVGLKYVYVGNVPGHEGENTYCPQCGRVVIGRIGYSITQMNLENGRCLFCQEDISGVWGP